MDKKVLFYICNIPARLSKFIWANLYVTVKQAVADLAKIPQRPKKTKKHAKNTEAMKLIGSD